MAKTISATVTINAAPAKVWAMLCDVGRWPEWWPDVSRATGTIQAESPVTVARTIPSRRRTLIMRYWVVTVQPEAELRLRSTRSAFGAELNFNLSPIDSGTRTEVVQSTTIPGHLVWLAWLVFAAQRTRLDGRNQALKHRTEQDPGTA